MIGLVLRILGVLLENGSKGSILKNLLKLAIDDGLNASGVKLVMDTYKRVNKLKNVNELDIIANEFFQKKAVSAFNKGVYPFKISLKGGLELNRGIKEIVKIVDKANPSLGARITYETYERESKGKEKNSKILTDLGNKLSVSSGDLAKMRRNERYALKKQILNDVNFFNNVKDQIASVARRHSNVHIPDISLANDIMRDTNFLKGKSLSELRSVRDTLAKELKTRAGLTETRRKKLLSKDEDKILRVEAYARKRLIEREYKQAWYNNMFKYVEEGRWSLEKFESIWSRIEQERVPSINKRTYFDD